MRNVSVRILEMVGAELQGRRKEHTRMSWSDLCKTLPRGRQAAVDIAENVDGGPHLRAEAITQQITLFRCKTTRGGGLGHRGPLVQRKAREALAGVPSEGKPELQTPPRSAFMESPTNSE